jgi:hypothetical protein
MKTKIVSTRLTQLDLNKIARYFNYCTTRQLIETIIAISENDLHFRDKITDKIKKQGKKIGYK